ncbi:recombinase family protein, partial [Nonomuraea angiospora]
MGLVVRTRVGPKVAAAAHPGDVLTVSELFRLRRDLIDIHAVRDWCQARGVALRVLSGPLSNFHDLAANAATTALLINVLTAVGQFQRDLQNELTAEGIAAAEAEGATAAGRPRSPAPSFRTCGRPSRNRARYGRQYAPGAEGGSTRESVILHTRPKTRKSPPTSGGRAW